MKNYSFLNISIILITAIFIPAKGKSSIHKDPGQGGILRLSEGEQDFTCTKGGLGNQCEYILTEQFAGEDDNERSATSKDTLTMSRSRPGDHDTNDGGAPPPFNQSLSTTRI